MFNSAFKKVNGIADRISLAVFLRIRQEPISTALLNLQGRNLERAKGCEFHFRELIRGRRSTWGEQSSKFKEISLGMLISTTPVAYTNALKNILEFISKDEKLAVLQK